jgi:acyl carrier protein
MSNKEDILAHLTDLIVDMKDCEASAVHAAASFEDLELDSLDFVEVQGAVKKRYRVDLVPDLFANGTVANVGQLVDYIVAETVVVEA